MILKNSKLSGDLPAQVGNLIAIENLDLSKNNFHGKLPTELSKLTRLDSLNLSSNTFIGNIPSKIRLLTKIRFLDLSNNQLSGELIAELTSLKNLLDLNLSMNNFSGCFEGFNDLCKVSKLNLTQNPLLPWSGDFGKFCAINKSQNAPCYFDGAVGYIDTQCRCRVVQKCDVTEIFIDTILCENDKLVIENKTLSKENSEIVISLIDVKNCDSIIHYRGQFVSYLCTDDCSNKDNYSFPSGFSPNGDGLNDFYIIEGLQECKNNLLEPEITIVNRWGQKVYHSKNYNNDWDGTDLSGNQLPEGTYYYEIAIDKSRGINSTGYIIIIR